MMPTALQALFDLLENKGEGFGFREVSKIDADEDGKTIGVEYDGDLFFIEVTPA